MDKVKEFVAKAWKHRFWVLTGAVSLLGLLFWFLGTRGIAGDTASRMSSVNDAFSAVQTVSSTQNHPNEEFHEEQKKINDALADAVKFDDKLRHDGCLLIFVKDQGR